MFLHYLLVGALADSTGVASGVVLLLFLVIMGGYTALRVGYSKYEKKGLTLFFLLGGTPRENFLISPSRKEGYPVIAMFSLTASWLTLVALDLYKPDLLSGYTAFGYALFFLAGSIIMFILCLIKYIFIRIIPANNTSLEASEMYYHEYMQYSRTAGFILFFITGLLLFSYYTSIDLVKNVLKIFIIVFTLMRPIYIIFKLRFLIPSGNLLNFSYFCTLETVPAVFILKFIA